MAYSVFINTSCLSTVLYSTTKAPTKLEHCNETMKNLQCFSFYSSVALQDSFESFKTDILLFTKNLHFIPFDDVKTKTTCLR